ncbi:MAG: hypothetical protein JNM88_17660 [Chitinophagaceae bacterium]|nr:hypothetical protein [Chitinophagaceae bacterium]
MKHVVFLLLLIYGACVSGPTKYSEPQNDFMGSVISNDSLFQCTTDRQAADVCVIKDSSPFKLSAVHVISMQKVSDSNFKGYNQYLDNCSDWKLSDSDITSIIKESELISDANIRHYFYDYYPCNYKGKVNLDGKIGVFNINAGAITSITFIDSTILMGYKLPDYKKYFITGYTSLSEFHD